MSEATVSGPAGTTAYQPKTPWLPFQALLAAIGAVLLAFVAAGVLAISGIAYGLEQTPVLVFSTIAQQIVMIVAALWLSGLRGGRAREVLALQPPRAGVQSYVFGLVTVVVCVVAMTSIIHSIDPELIKSDLRQFNTILQSPIWWAMFPMAGLGAPLAEELLFRGFLFSALAKSRLGLGGAAVVTSAAWAVVHAYSWVGILQVFVIGLIFSWMLIRTGSLRVPIVVHAIYNTALAALMVSEAGGGLTR